MMDDPVKTDDTTKRPVWSHKTDNGYLEDFLKGDPERDEAHADSDSTDTNDADTAATVSDETSPADNDLKDRIIAVLKQIYDPEIPVNIYELGLIYDVAVDDAHNVNITMTLTTPHCPVAEAMPNEVATKVRSVEDVNDVDVNMVWDPPWDMSRMSDEARLELGLL